MLLKPYKGPNNKQKRKKHLTAMHVFNNDNKIETSFNILLNIHELVYITWNNKSIALAQYF